MKRIFLAMVAVLMLVAVGFSQTQPTVGQVLEFAWEQETASLEGITGWMLYESNVSGTGYTKVLEIPYVSGAGPTFTGEGTITFTGAKGSTVTKYFVLTAKSKDASGEESTFSNEASVGVVIPYGKPSSPFTFRVNIKTK